VVQLTNGCLNVARVIKCRLPPIGLLRTLKAVSEDLFSSALVVRQWELCKSRRGVGLIKKCVLLPWCI